MVMPFPAVSKKAKGGGAAITAPKRMLPKRARSIVLRATSRAGLRRLRLQIWSIRLPFLLATTLFTVALMLWRDTRPVNISAVLNSVMRNRAKPLTPDSFDTLAHTLLNYSTNNTPLLTDEHLVGESTKKWATKRDKAVPADDWDAMADDVAFAVKTGREVAHDRLHKLSTSGWLSTGRRVPNLLVVADEAIPELGVIDVKRYALDVVVGALRNNSTVATVSNTGKSISVPKRWFDRHGWRGDKDKNLPTLHLLRRTFPNAKWYVLLDDDTYIFLDNFARYMVSAPDDKPVYTGKVFYISNCGGFARNGDPKPDSGIHTKGLFAHGGSGIFMNKHAMNTIYPVIGSCIREFSGCWAGDMQVGLCVNAQGVQVHNFKHGHSHEYMFTPFWPSRAMADSRYTRRLKSDLEPVTFHKIPSQEAKLVAEFDALCARQGKPVTYKNLRIFLQDRGIQPQMGWRPTKFDTHVFFRKK